MSRLVKTRFCLELQTSERKAVEYTIGLPSDYAHKFLEQILHIFLLKGLSSKITRDSMALFIKHEAESGGDI